MAPSHRSSPQETIRIISPRRSNEIDYGHDGGHQIRHITRSTRLDAFAGEGTPRGWSWVLQSLTYRRSDRGLGCPVSILDTVIYASDGSPETLYYTDGENAVASRTIGEDQGCITFADAIVHLERSKTRTDAAETTGAVAFTLGGEVVSIKTADLAKIRKGQGTVPNATQALVLSVSTKAPPAEPLLSVQHTFALEASSAKPLHRSYRLAMMKGAARRVPCQSATVNRELMRVCNKVLEWIEARSGARVLRLILEFVEDDLGRLLLVRASKCFVTETVRLYSQERQSPSPSQSKTARLQIADRIANELSILRYGHGIGESIPSSAGGLAAAVSRPEVTSLRQMELARKAHTAMSRADASNDQGPVDPVEWGFHQSPSPLRVADAYRPKTTASARTSRKRALGREVDNDIGSMFRKFASPEERYPREVGRTVAAGRALGSTQLGRMCHGDFCVTELPDKVATSDCIPQILRFLHLFAKMRAKWTDTRTRRTCCVSDFTQDTEPIFSPNTAQIQQQARFEKEETGNGSLGLALSSRRNRDTGIPAAREKRVAGTATHTPATEVEAGSFVQRLLQLDESTLQDFGVLPAEGGLVGRVDEATPGKTRTAATQDGSHGVVRRQSKRQAIAVEVQGNQSGDPGEWNEIPFSWVVRGRQERHLIDHQLRRYRRGHNEPFVGHLSGLGESSLPLGAIFPATYYQSVRVCQNCYRVYTMIDAARTKSIRRLNMRTTTAATAAVAAGGIRDEQRNSLKDRRQRQDAARERRGEKRDQPYNDKIHRKRGRSRQGLPIDRVWSAQSSQNAHTEEDVQKGACSLSVESMALVRAQKAIDGLTRGDICELRTFSKPPAAVTMVTAALMIILTGHGEPTAAGWVSAKRYMTNIDKLFAALAGLDVASLKLSQTSKVETYAKNPAFRPEVVACVSIPASKICAWVLGILEAHRWRNGRGHSRVDMLKDLPGAGESSLYTKGGNLAGHRDVVELPSDVVGENSTGTGYSKIGMRPRTSSVRRNTAATAAAAAAAASCVSHTLGPAVYPMSSRADNASAAFLSTATGQERSDRYTSGKKRPVISTHRGVPQPAVPQAWVPMEVGSNRGQGIGTPTQADNAPQNCEGREARGVGIERTLESSVSKREGPVVGATKAGLGSGQSRAAKVAAKGRQDRVAQRLADATAGAPDPAGFERSEFLCGDGLTMMPYAIVGVGVPTRGQECRGHGALAYKEAPNWSQKATRSPAVMNFVAVHDFFDTLEKTFLLFKPLVLKYPGCQVLCFNSPGQAGTRIPKEPSGLLTSAWVADRLDELMQHVDNMGELPLSDRPFHLLGIGYGANIATALACQHGERWKGTMRSLACMNGFAAVDTQLAAVLHSAERAFQCFPLERPDLPITFWSRFIFSEEYLQSVGPDLALNILCAVANPLSTEGMRRIVKGALASVDLRPSLLNMTLPLILVQSTENVLINAANVDLFLEGRRPRHVWSHQLRLRATPGAEGPTPPTDHVSNFTAMPCGAAADPQRPCGRSEETGRLAEKGQPLRGSTCLGQDGEQALFESLSARSQGAFVAWVKGGHEIRQECKRLVTDVLDLMTAPGGQSEDFFRKTSREKGFSEGRVGIAAKKSPLLVATITAATTTGPMVPAVPGGVVVEVSPGLALTKDGTNAVLNMGKGGGTKDSPLVANHYIADCAHARQAARKISLRSALSLVEGDANADHGHGKRQEEAPTCKKEARCNESAERRRLDSMDAYGFGSMRKIWERDRPPQLSNGVGTTRAPNARISRKQSGWNTAADMRRPSHVENGQLLKPSQGARHSRQRCKPSPAHRKVELLEPDTREVCCSDVATSPCWHTDRRGNRIEGPDIEERCSVSGRNIGASLDKAVADFDIALRDHRDKRRGLILPECDSDGTSKQRERRTEKDRNDDHVSRRHDGPACARLNGEATSWVAESIGWDESQEHLSRGKMAINTAGRSPRTGCQDGVALGVEAPSVPQDFEAADQVENVKVPLTVTHEVADDRIAGSPLGWIPTAVEQTETQAAHFQPLVNNRISATCALGLSGEAGEGDIVEIAVHARRPSRSRTSSPSHCASPLSHVGSERGKTTRCAVGGVPDDNISSHVGVLQKSKNSESIESRLAGEVLSGSLFSSEEVAHETEASFQTCLHVVTKLSEETSPNARQHMDGEPLEMVVPAPAPSVHGRTPTASVDAAPASGIVESEAAVVSFGKSTNNLEVSPTGAFRTPSAPTSPACIASAPVARPVMTIALDASDPISNDEQRSTGDWLKSVSSEQIPEPLTAAREIALAEAGLAERVRHLQSQRAAADKIARVALNDGRAQRLGREHADRLLSYVDADQQVLAAEDRRLADLRRKANLSRLQRGADFEETDVLIGKETARVEPTITIAAVPVRGMRPQHYIKAENLPSGLDQIVGSHPADKVLDEMEELAAQARTAASGLTVEEFERVQQRQLARQVERLEILHGQSEEDKELTRGRMALRLQLFARSTFARARVYTLRRQNLNSHERTSAATGFQAVVRGHLARTSVSRTRRLLLDEAVLGGRATAIQRVFRGRRGRAVYLMTRKESRARVLQRAARGYLGRGVAKRKRAQLAHFASRASSAAKIQSAWRGKMAQDSYLRVRCSWLASREIQRTYRGHLARRATRRRRDWQSAGPGAERLKLGMRMIEDTKVAFVKQQDEIAALNRAQEKAEARVSSIHHKLTASESELSTLEGEMAEIDHLERELVQLTHERDLLNRGITGAAGLPKTGRDRHDGQGGNSNCGGGGSGSGGGRGGDTGGRLEGSRKADAYALEMQLQLKRAEREQRRQQLAAEFASTFADVSDKKQQLDRLSAAVGDIEATRLRKSREFGHMQRNLMELLSEQKRELDHVREKGIQLETAAATSAAAAAATAQRARDHEAKAAAMYGQTEELMKFQFMSMSLSYFSSLNMMKQMRDINADTTTAAVAGSADAAAAAAASAAAASIPSLTQIHGLGGDAITHALAIRKEQARSTRTEIDEAEESQRHPFPAEVGLWTVDDVGRWLDTLQLGEYKQAFREGKVDGSFLADLRESDLMDSIGMEHKLHLKKLLLARQKILPLSEVERSMASSVRAEEQSKATRDEIPDVQTAFSQARHGKKRRLEETLNMGFNIESEDEMGNTLLLVAVQQLQMGLVEFLVQRRANVNHRNSGGNTALHFAMSYDTSGKMGEYLINNGADDTIENNNGASPYDGI